MNESELKERIKKGEDFHTEHTEFKKTLLDKNKIIKEIVGFANTDGGQLIFGVTDGGESIYYDETTLHRANFKDIHMDSFEEFLLLA
jgi:predicted HTH transcriptional regulator